MTLTLKLNPPTSGLSGLNYTTRSPWQVGLKSVKFVLNKAYPIICNLVVGSEFGQFGKMFSAFTTHSEVCAQQIMSNHLPGSSLHWVITFVGPNC